MSNESLNNVKPETDAAILLSLEQYKAKLADLGNLGNRHTSMTMYYVSIVSAIFGLLALKERAIADIETSILLVVCTVGLLICVLWFLSLSFFRNLFRAKLSVLKQMEATLPYQTFISESEIILKHKINSWMRIERIVPIIFGLLFFTLVIIRIAKNL
jgi:hypothetical protein